MDNDKESTHSQSDTGSDQDHGTAPRSEAEELEALIRDLADAYDHQVAEQGGDIPALSAVDNNAGFVSRYLEAGSNNDGVTGEALPPVEEESVDDVISRLLADTHELGRLDRNSNEFQPLIEEIETLWRQLREIWPAVQLNPHTAARLEELWNTLKTGSEDSHSELGSLFSVAVDDNQPVTLKTDAAKPPGITSTADTGTGENDLLTGDADLDAILQRVTDESVPSTGDTGQENNSPAAGSGAESGTANDNGTLDELLAGLANRDGSPEIDDRARSRTAAITESVDDIIARILGDGSDLESAESDPWRDAPAVVTDAPTNADDEMAAYLASLDIDVNAMPESAGVNEEDLRRYLDDLDTDSVETTNAATGGTTAGPAAGLSFISDEERAILDNLLGSDEASLTPTEHAPGDETLAALQTESDNTGLTSTSTGMTESLDDELARILNEAGVTPGVNNDPGTLTDPTSNSQNLEASREADDLMSTPTTDGAGRARGASEAGTPASRAPAQPTPAPGSWPSRPSGGNVSANDSANTEAMTAGERSLREQPENEIAEEGGNWLIPLAAAILIGGGLWLLWGMLDNGPDRGETLAQDHAHSSAHSPKHAKSEATPVSKRQAPAPSQVRSTVRKQVVAPATPVVSNTETEENSFVRDKFQNRESVAESAPFVAPSAEDSGLAEPVFVPPQDTPELAADALPQETYQGPEQTYIPPRESFQASDQVFTPPRDEAFAEPVYAPPQPVAAEPIQPYTPPVVAEVDLGPLEGALERLRNSTSDSITELSERVTRLERLIAGLHDSIDSLLRQSSASASQSLSNLQQIQERIVVLEEGQQKVVDAAIQRDSEGYTIIVNNVDGTNLLPGQSSREIIHIVKKGDTLWDIAKTYINNPWRYPELARLSKIKNPDLIYPGDRIRILLKARQ